jgi:hypothetical protein
MNGRTPKPRPSLSGAFTQAPKANTPKSVTSTKTSDQLPESKNTPSKSSAALREQIAKAKAAKKSAAAHQIKPSDSTAPSNGFNFDFDLPSDPFNQLHSGGGDAVLRRRIDTARADGRLNIAAMGLNEIPEAVLKMYDFEANSSSAVQWGEVVDLVRFNAADNDIEIIQDSVFPDLDPHDAVEDDMPGPQFGGVEVLDVHGNLLRDVPIGLRRLQRLTTLNLVSTC